jgi:hypothetical protein
MLSLLCPCQGHQFSEGSTRFVLGKHRFVLESIKFVLEKHKVCSRVAQGFLGKHNFFREAQGLF